MTAWHVPIRSRKVTMMEDLAYDEQPVYEQYGNVTVAMSPPPTMRHINIAGNIYRIIGNYLKGKRCKVFPDGAKLFLGEEFRFLPDAMVVCDRSKIHQDGIHGAPDLVVEVLSPATSKRDKLLKKDAYEKYGVKEYWIVAPDEQSIEVYHLDNLKFRLDNIYSIIPDWMLAEMTEKERAAVELHLKVSLYDDLIIDIREIFEDV